MASIAFSRADKSNLDMKTVLAGSVVIWRNVDRRPKKSTLKNHLNKLVVLHLSILYTARHLQQLIRLLVCQFLSDAGEEVSHLRHRDGATPVLVVHSKHLPEGVWFLRRRVRHVGADELDQRGQVHISPHLLDLALDLVYLCLGGFETDRPHDGANVS